MTTRNRYSSAPTYGMLKKPAPKKQAAPKAPFFAPAGKGPFAAQQTPPPGYGPAGAMPPQPQGYAPQPGGFIPPQASGFGPSQPANFTPSQPVGYSPNQTLYATPAASYMPQQGFAPGQQNFAAQGARQAAMPPAQPVFYPPQQTYPVPPMPQDYGARMKARSGDSWLQICLLGVLPVLFILTLFLSAPFLKWAFIVLAVLSLGAMWYKRAFVSSARTTLSLVYGALILVSAVSLITGMAPPDDRAASARGNPGNGGNSGLVSTGTTSTPPPQPAADGNTVNGGQTTESTPPPTTNSGEKSEAWVRLEQFFSFWMLGKHSDMLNLVLPTWVSAQEKPANSMFQVLANRSPEDYTFEKISGSDTDSSRTVTMTSVINKNNGRDPVKIRFNVLMLKVDNQWYVDPNTLASNDEVKEEDLVTNTQGGEEGGDDQSKTSEAPKATPTPGPKTKLYYNKQGGKYYHIDSKCKSVAEEYLPLTNFLYKDLNDTAFKNLLPCPDCHAPDRP